MPPDATGFRKQKGNALFLILIAVALFAALSYAVTKSTRGGGDITKEKAILDGGLAQQCIASVERAANMLKLVGKCADDQISYELPDGTNENPSNPGNKDCFVFDKQGGDTAPCGTWLQPLGCSASAMLALSAGQKCAGGDVVYVGVSGGNRIYTTSANQGSAAFATGVGCWVWNNPHSDSDGLANTDTLVTLSDGCNPYPAAAVCRSLGAKWYLPAKDELNLLYTARNTGVLSGTLTGTLYWTSTGQDASSWSSQQDFSTGTQLTGDRSGNLLLRCVRRD